MRWHNPMGGSRYGPQPKIVDSTGVHLSAPFVIAP